MIKALGKKLISWNTVNTIGAVSQYQSSREEGNGVISSAAGAAADLGLSLILPMPLYLGFQAVSNAGAIMKGYEAADQWRRGMAFSERNHAFQNAHFNDSEQAYTMRQAGMEIAKRSKYNTQQAMMGNEAKYMMR